MVAITDKGIGVNVPMDESSVPTITFTRDEFVIKVIYPRRRYIMFVMLYWISVVLWFVSDVPWFAWICGVIIGIPFTANALLRKSTNRVVLTNRRLIMTWVNANWKPCFAQAPLEYLAEISVGDDKISIRTKGDFWSDKQLWQACWAWGNISLDAFSPEQLSSTSFMKNEIKSKCNLFEIGQVTEMWGFVHLSDLVEELSQLARSHPSRELPFAHVIPVRSGISVFGLANLSRAGVFSLFSFALLLVYYPMQYMRQNYQTPESCLAYARVIAEEWPRALEEVRDGHSGQFSRTQDLELSGESLRKDQMKAEIEQEIFESLKEESSFTCFKNFVVAELDRPSVRAYARRNIEQTGKVHISERSSPKGPFELNRQASPGNPIDVMR